MDDIRALIKEDIDARTKVGFIPIIHTMVLDHGEVHKGIRFRGDRGERRMCYQNALHYALHNGLDYVEGLACSGSLKFRLLIDHAWCVDKKGNAIDPTWDKPVTSLYMGIRFTAAEAMKICLKKRRYQVFQAKGGDGTIDVELIEKLYPEYKGKTWRCESKRRKEGRL